MRHAVPALLGLLVGLLVSRLPPRADADPSPAGPPDFAAVAAAAEASVVHVTTVLEGGRQPSSRDDAVGAGFVVAAEGLVVTSRHVVSGARRVFVDVLGRGTAEAQVVGTDDATDVALLRVPHAGLPVLPIGEPGRLRVGQWVLAAGSPYHMPRSWSAGIVSGLHRTGIGASPRAFEDYIQTDAAANVGSSGGPLLDASGRVVGVLTAILSRTGVSQGVSLAVPVDAVMAAVARMRGGPSSRPLSLGISVRETVLPGAGAALEITRFEAGSPAAAGGLQVGDAILSLDGVPASRTADVQRALWSKPPGSQVVVVFRRGGRRYQVAILPR